MIDDLSLAALKEQIEGAWGASLEVRATTESTMDDASSAAREGAAEGHVILADQQSAGRGAHGREWVSPAGTDLYFSIVTRPAVDPRLTPLVTLATGLGVRDALAELLPHRSVQVKWPNDIWIGGRKCAGILVESRVVGTKLEAIIIGVGLNVNRTVWPAELEGSATSLRMEGSEGEAFDRAYVFGVVLSHIERWVTRFVRDGAPALLSALRPHLALVGAPVRWEDGRGVFEGIDENGAALARTHTGVVALHAARIERDGAGA